jgi:peptidoglycan/LPS O-acetylase OafA/YrhL
MRSIRVTGERRRIWPLVIAAGVCLFVGFWGFVYQGYTEDAGFEPVQSWPIGVGGYLLGGVLILWAIRRARPRISDRGMALVTIGVTAFLIAMAIVALAGGRGP